MIYKPTKIFKPKSQETFRSWLSIQAEQDSPLGDLARDVKKDRGWSGKTVTSLRDRLHDLRVSREVLEALEEARKLYEEATGTTAADKVSAGMKAMTCQECEEMGFVKADWDSLSKAYICPVCDGYGFYALDPNGDNDWEVRLSFYEEVFDE